MKKILITLLILPNIIFAQTNRELSPKDFQARLTDQNSVLLDVRTPGEFKGGHIDKAVNKNIFDPDFDSYSTKLDKGKTYFVYCLSGKRSHNAAEQMRKKGLKVYELKGGLESWTGAKLPLTR